ncbi:MAG: hypothetical protein ACXAC7_21915 [Candidatus Hodarchaeales archaeon]|jgi:hypothetical protein
MTLLEILPSETYYFERIFKSTTYIVLISCFIGFIISKISDWIQRKMKKDGQSERNRSIHEGE